MADVCEECKTVHGPGNTNTYCPKASNYREPIRDCPHAIIEHQKKLGDALRAVAPVDSPFRIGAFFLTYRCEVGHVHVAKAVGFNFQPGEALEDNAEHIDVFLHHMEGIGTDLVRAVGELRREHEKRG